MIEGQIRWPMAQTPLSGRIEGIIVPVERFLGVLTPIIGFVVPFPLSMSSSLPHRRQFDPRQVLWLLLVGFAVVSLQL